MTDSIPICFFVFLLLCRLVQAGSNRAFNPTPLQCANIPFRIWLSYASFDINQRWSKQKCYSVCDSIDTEISYQYNFNGDSYKRRPRSQPRLNRRPPSSDSRLQLQRDDRRASQQLSTSKSSPATRRYSAGHDSSMETWFDAWVTRSNKAFNNPTERDTAFQNFVYNNYKSGRQIGHPLHEFLDLPSDEFDKKAFEDYIKKYQKRYWSDSERKEAFENFKQNVVKSKRGAYNQFLDLSPSKYDELSAILGRDM